MWKTECGGWLVNKFDCAFGDRTGVRKACVGQSQLLDIIERKGLEAVL